MKSSLLINNTLKSYIIDHSIRKCDCARDLGWGGEEGCNTFVVCTRMGCLSDRMFCRRVMVTLARNSLSLLRSEKMADCLLTITFSTLSSSFAEAAVFNKCIVIRLTVLHSCCPIALAATTRKLKFSENVWTREGGRAQKERERERECTRIGIGCQLLKESQHEFVHIEVEGDAAEGFEEESVE